jgi:cysteine-rich repeat protein
MTRWCQPWLLAAAACGGPSPPLALAPQEPQVSAHAAISASPVVPAPAPTSCGDAKIQAGETCDDGNTVSGDGCAATCRREPLRFLGWDYVLLSDFSIVSTMTREALPGRVTLFSPEAALVQTAAGLRYFSGGPQLLSLPKSAGIAMLGAGSSPCVLNDSGDVYCVGGTLSDSERPHFEHGPEVTEAGVTITWNKLRRQPGAVAGLAGNIDVGCILLDGATATQCWRRETSPPYSSISRKMPLGRAHVAQQIVAGSEHVCVLSRDGKVGCWGDSSFGQTGYMAELIPGTRPELGVPERNRRTPPVKFIELDSPAKQLAASGYETCALLENGKLWCWGDTDALAFAASDEPTCSQRMESERVDPRLGPVPKPLTASTLPHSPIKLPSACSVKDFSLVSGQLCVSCQGGCSKCWGQSDATLNVKRAEPPSDCLTY